MFRISSGTVGEARVRMLRIVRRGDRHDPHDLTVAVRLEGDFAGAFTAGEPDVLVPGETVRNVVHAAAREHATGEIEPFGLVLCDRLLATTPRASRVRVEISDQPWARLEVGGKAQGQAFLAASPERRTAAVTSNGRQAAVVSGIDQLTIMRSSGFAPPRRTRDPEGADDGLQPLLVATLGARWTYTSVDVTFGPYRQGVRTAIVETLGCHARLSVPHTLHAIADVVLASYQEIAEITLSVQERPCRPVDLFSAGIENPDDLFVVRDEPVGVVEITVER
jgi:urate oxidase